MCVSQCQEHISNLRDDNIRQSLLCNDDDDGDIYFAFVCLARCLNEKHDVYLNLSGTTWGLFQKGG